MLTANWNDKFQMTNDKLFLKEIEARLEENRRLMEVSFIPRPLSRAASYLGFHVLSSLLLLSLLVTAFLYEVFNLRLMEVSKVIFLLN